MVRRWLPLVLGVLLTAALVTGSAGCGGSGGGEKGGTVRISGAWALYPMVVKWAEEYEKTHQGTRIDVSAGGAGKGVADALGGLVDIGMVSREIKPEEEKQGAFYVPVVKDAVVPVVNDGNPVLWKGLAEKGFTKEILEGIYISGDVTTWGQAAKSDDPTTIQVYTRSDACGAAETWAKFLGDKKQEDLKGVAVYGDPGLAEAVKKDPNGIGYNNLNYAYDAKTGLPVSGLFIVPIDSNGNGKVDPGEDLKTKNKAIAAIKSGDYPSPPARDLYLLGKGKVTGAAQQFVEWVLTDGQQYVDAVGYIQLTQAQLDEALKKVQ